MSDAVIVRAETQHVIVSAQQRLVVKDRMVAVVNSSGSVAVVSAGPQGPPGMTGSGGDLSAQGTINNPSVLWVMFHDLNESLDQFNPADWWFEDENGNPMEPIEVLFINQNVAQANWLDPVRGSWRK